MTITIILPIYGKSPWLKDALQSVNNQECTDWELLIADDGIDKGKEKWLAEWIEENRSKIKIIDIKYGSSVTMDASKEDDVRTPMFVSGALVLYEEV